RAATSSTAARPVPAAARPRARRTSTPTSPGGTRATTPPSPARRGRRQRFRAPASLLDVDGAGGERTELERRHIRSGIDGPRVAGDLRRAPAAGAGAHQLEARRFEDADGRACGCGRAPPEYGG